MAEAGRGTLIARADDLQFLKTLLQQHGTLYEAAQAMPRIAELRGRGVAYAAQFGNEVWAIRHYQRGGSVMTVLGDRYARVSRPRVMSELQVSDAARSRGIATPEIRAGAWYHTLMFTRCDVATRYIPDSSDLANILFESTGETQRAVAAATGLIRAMIDGGLLHRDLNLKNILIAPEGAYVLDLDRARMVGKLSRSQIVAMHDRFFRSLNKFEARTGRNLPAQIADAFHEAFRG